MDLGRQFQEFLQRFQTTGWILVFMAGGFVLQAVLYIVAAAMGDVSMYAKIIDYLVLPAKVGDFLYQPWSMFTYPFFWKRVDILIILIHGSFVWMFGMMHQQFLSDLRTRRMLLLAVPFIAILTVLIWPLIPEPTNLISSTVFGITPLMVVLAISCATLAPTYPVQLFLLGQVKIVWVAVILVALTLAWAVFQPLGIAVAVAALLGFLHVYLLKKGTDITELIWSYYPDKSVPPPSPPQKMKVTPGGKHPSRSANQMKQRARTDDSITQEVIDRLLDKISASGYDSLSREEREILFKASTQKEDDQNN